MANQKYEINKRIQRHIKEIKDPVPSYDVVRWKDAVHAPTKPVGSNLQTDMLHEKKIHQRNVELSNRLFSIMKENREARSYQYAPGWRAGLGESRQKLILCVCIPYFYTSFVRWRCH